MSTVNLLQMVISDYKKHIMNYLLQTTKIYTIHFETLNNLTELRPLHLSQYKKLISSHFY